MTVRHYKHTDAGAPVLSGQAGALNAVLKACLVDGFGSLPAAGWTVAYEDAPTNRIVFRQPAGQSAERYLWLNDNNANGAVVRGYDTMSAVETGTDQFTGADVRYWQKSSTSNDTARAWHLFSDDAGGSFWLATQRQQAATDMEPPVANNSGFFVYGFGDVDHHAYSNEVQQSWLAGDTQQSSATAAGLVPSSGNSALGLGANLQCFAFPRNGVATGPARSSWNTAVEAVQGSFANGRVGAGWLGSASQVVGPRFRIQRGDAVGTAVGASGHVPGLHLPMANLANSYHGQTIDVILDGLQRDLFMLAVCGRSDTATNLTTGGCGIWFFDLTGPWGA